MSSTFFTSKLCSAPTTQCTCFIILNFEDRPIFLHFFTSKNASCHSGAGFFDISISKNASKLRCFVFFDLEMCLAPQRRANFFKTSRFSEPTFRPSGAANHWKKRSVSRLFLLFWRTCIFFLLILSSDSFSCLIFFHLSPFFFLLSSSSSFSFLLSSFFFLLSSFFFLLSSFFFLSFSSFFFSSFFFLLSSFLFPSLPFASLRFSSLLFSYLLFSSLLFSSLTLPTSAFSSVQIVGSLTSKLPSMSLCGYSQGSLTFLVGMDEKLSTRQKARFSYSHRDGSQIGTSKDGVDLIDPIMNSS